MLVSSGHSKEICGGEANTTNNRMEMTAVIRALESLKRPSTIEVHTDSQYVQKGISEWMTGWKKRNWRTADGKPVKNQDLWLQLDSLSQLHSIKWKWVKGHSMMRCPEFGSRPVVSVSRMICRVAISVLHSL